MLQLNKQIQPLIDEIMTAVDQPEYSYKQKETALHVVNEMLFHELITNSSD